MRFACLLLALVLLGCTKTATSTGIPNLAEVEPGLWRSGQPATRAQWQWLKDHGVKHVVKLNFEGEGTDDDARALGLDVHELSVQPEGDLDWFNDITHTFVRPDSARLTDAEFLIVAGGGVLVHCTHGQDRTGLVIGLHRVLHEHWTKAQAYDEMLARGFHPELHGLHEFWEDFDGKVIK
jgi:tyrosine-protein phosphatase SIW14